MTEEEKRMPAEAGLQEAADEELLLVSARLIEQNMQAYEVLAQ